MQKLFDIFQEALEAERASCRRYEEAAGLCGDPELKKILLDFAEEERKHEREILVRFREIARKMPGGLH
ncbi:MAG: ferritin family protein [Acidobacteriota bacterium]